MDGLLNSDTAQPNARKQNSKQTKNLIRCILYHSLARSKPRSGRNQAYYKDNLLHIPAGAITDNVGLERRLAEFDVVAVLDPGC